MLDQITGMQVFVRVAVLGSLSGAARALGMSQTVATKYVGAREQRLGVKLLHRTTRRITLTEPGRRYLESVERIPDKPKPPRRMPVGGFVVCWLRGPETTDALAHNRKLKHIIKSLH